MEVPGMDYLAELSVESSISSPNAIVAIWKNHIFKEKAMIESPAALFTGESLNR